MTTDLTIRVVADGLELESLAGDWECLLQTMGRENVVYLTHEWVSTWWNHFGEGRQLHVLVFERRGDVIGIIPLVSTEYRLGLLDVRLLESAGALNCNYVSVVSPENSEEVASAFLAHLDEELPRGGQALRLSYVPDDSMLLSLLRREAPQATKLALKERTMTEAPYAVLPRSWEELRSSLSRKRKWVLRSAMRALETAHTVEFQRCDGDAVEHTLEELIDLHQKRWGSLGISGFFRDERMRSFYRDVARRFGDRGWLHLSRLNIDGDLASALFGVTYNGKLYAGMSARDTRYSRYSVGHLHFMFLFQDAIEQGLGELDFLKGDEPYKLYWTKSVRRYQQVTVIGGARCLEWRYRFLRSFFRAHDLRRFGLKESLRLRQLRKRAEAEQGRMRLGSRG